MQRKIGRAGERAEIGEEFDDGRSDGDRANLHADRCSEKRFFVEMRHTGKEISAAFLCGSVSEKRRILER